MIKKIKNICKKIINKCSKEYKKRIKNTPKNLLEGTLKYIIRKKYRRIVNYTVYFKKCKINEKIIMYESHKGNSMSDSPLAIFNYLIDKSEYRDYKHIWAINDTKTYQKKYLKIKNVKFVKVNSRKYLKYLASSKILINNSTFPGYFIRKNNQLYINTWHGTPLKTLGKDMKGTPGQYKNIQRNFLQATHIINPNKYTSEKIISSHDLNGLYSGYIADIGSARIDLTINSDRESLKKRLNIKNDKKIILYAPTWRGEVGRVDKEIKEFVEDYKKIEKLLNNKYHVLFRVHPLMQKELNNIGLGGIVVSEDIDTNELLGVIDLLITDYSSIMFDFLTTKKPIIFYIRDEIEYEKNRGMYIKLDNLPGKICRTIDEVINSLKNICKISRKYKKVYDKWIEQYCYNDDGKATERLIDIIFNNETKYLYKILDNKKNILLYCGGFQNNGITTSAINLLNNIDYDKYNICLVENGNFNSVKTYNMNKVNKNVKKIFKFGTMNMTIGENIKQSKVFHNGFMNYKKENLNMKNVYEREINRIFSYINFDIVIDFSGYVKYWSLLFAYSNYNRKVIYQHNDMLAEYNKIIEGKFKHKENLRIIFKVYNEFDIIVSVSEAIRNLNIENMRKGVKKLQEKSVYVHNSINYNEIINKSESNSHIYFKEKKYRYKQRILSIEKSESKNEINFLNIGRLSPEKGQIKLIEAFREICNKYNNTYLYILGDGVLKNEIQYLIKQLGLEKKVFLMGQVNNPYPIIKKCDCFVFSSNHEGQPMVLLEALVLEKSIVATDIPGNRGILKNGYGTLVENNRLGLQYGMENYINQKSNIKKFDYIKYNNEAMNMFYINVCGEK